MGLVASTSSATGDRMVTELVEVTRSKAADSEVEGKVLSVL